MKKCLMLIGISLFLSANLSYAESQNPFKPLPKVVQLSNNNGNGSVGEEQIQNLKNMLNAEMVQLQNLRADVNQLKEMNTKKAVEQRKQKKKEQKAIFIGIVDGKKLFKDKETGDFFTEKVSQSKNSKDSGNN